MSFEKNKEIDNFSMSALWFIAGIIIMGVGALIINAKTHSDVELCSTDNNACKVWLREVDNGSCKILVEHLNSTKDKDSKSFYECR